MQSAALATRQLAHVLLLIDALEIEAPEIRTRRHFEFADRQDIEPSGNRFPGSLAVGQGLARLIDHRKLRGRADDDLSLVRFFGAGNHPEQRRLARAVWSNDAHDRAGWDAEPQVVDQQPFAIAFADAVKLDHLITQPLGDRNEDFLRLVWLLVLVAGKLLEPRNARLAFRLSPLGVGTHPFELGVHRLDTRRFLFRLGLQALLLLLEQRTVVAFPWN